MSRTKVWEVSDMLTAVIESENDTLLVELPKSVFDLQMNLMSIGVRFPPNEIPLRDEESSSLRVKLYGQNEVGQKLCLLLSDLYRQKGYPL